MPEFLAGGLGLVFLVFFFFPLNGNMPVLRDMTFDDLICVLLCFFSYKLCRRSKNDLSPGPRRQLEN